MNRTASPMRKSPKISKSHYKGPNNIPLPTKLPTELRQLADETVIKKVYDLKNVSTKSDTFMLSNDTSKKISSTDRFKFEEFELICDCKMKILGLRELVMKTDEHVQKLEIQLLNNLKLMGKVEENLYILQSQCNELE